MTTSYPVLSKVALAASTLGFAQDEFCAVDAEADAALHEVAEFSQHAKLWRKADVHLLADLNKRAYEAEERRRHARDKLVFEFCEAVRVTNAEEET